MTEKAILPKTERIYCGRQSMKKKRGRYTPLVMRVPILVTKPLILSDLNEDRARVEPGSVGASNATHSCSPLFKDAKLSCSRFKSHSSSHAYKASTCYTFRSPLPVVRYQRVLFLYDQLLGGYWWPDCSRHDGIFPSILLDAQ